jgi:hypothetical protein
MNEEDLAKTKPIDTVDQEAKKIIDRMLGKAGTVGLYKPERRSRLLEFLRDVVDNPSFLLGVLTPFTVFGVMVGVTLYINWFWRIV